MAFLGANALLGLVLAVDFVPGLKSIVRIGPLIGLGLGLDLLKGIPASGEPKRAWALNRVICTGHDYTRLHMTRDASWALDRVIRGSRIRIPALGVLESFLGPQGYCQQRCSALTSTCMGGAYGGGACA